MYLNATLKIPNDKADSKADNKIAGIFLFPTEPRGIVATKTLNENLRRIP